MQLLKIGICLLPGIAFSSAQVEPAPISQNGDAIVVNDCSFSVYYKSVSSHPVLSSAIPPGGTYKETYQLNIDPNGNLGGISIKLSSNQSIANAANMSDAFDASTITQFEYTYNPNVAPGLFYDISNVNGYLDEYSGSWPFEIFGGLILEGTSSECPSVTCPPNINICSAAYTHWNDDWATHSCQNNNSLILTLCSTISNLEASKLALTTNSLGSMKEVIASTRVSTATATATGC